MMSSMRMEIFPSRSISVEWDIYGYYPMAFSRNDGLLYGIMFFINITPTPYYFISPSFPPSPLFFLSLLSFHPFLSFRFNHYFPFTFSPFIPFPDPFDFHAHFPSTRFASLFSNFSSLLLSLPYTFCQHFRD